ncbi:DUF4368 domain-containing protein [Paenibacillus sp. J22TS3]|uniref:DUF4368 domain-containing protein n=1 Tax=Paenibacillus sp. J22TS3 TaxID=2807192 RepID=UPI0035B52826
MIKRMKEELQRFMKMNELTPEMLHRLVEKIEVKQMKLRKSFIDLPFVCFSLSLRPVTYPK